MRALPLVLLLLSACAGNHRGPYGTSWDGRRGYSGSGDYGYDLSASRAAAASYRLHASRTYPVPGPSDDPWGPHIREAALRHAVPERWIREVMRQESGGRLHSADGSLITSRAGAMGLMQVMPRTYEMLRRRYGLGDDPYEPRDNILAGAAYIREMYDRFGVPNFLAAYNAGPERVEAYLAGSTVLPDETENYVARVAPRLGTELAAASPGTAYLPLSTAAVTYEPRRSTAYQDQVYRTTPTDPVDRAFAGGGLVTPSAPTGERTGISTARAYSTVDVGETATLPPSSYLGDTASPVMVARTEFSGRSDGPTGTRSLGSAAVTSGHFSAVAHPYANAALVSVIAPASWPGNWGIQVGAFPDPAASRAAVAAAQLRAPGFLAGAQALVVPVSRNGTLYRARLMGLPADTASAACAALAREGMACFPVPPGS